MLLTILAALAKPPLGTRALQAYEAGDLVRATKWSTKALKKNPEDIDALTASGYILIRYIDQAPDEERSFWINRYVQIVADLQRLAPDEMHTAILADQLLDDEGVQVTYTEPECSIEAQAAARIAENAFNQKQLDVAVVAYTEALEQCDAHATWWVWLGDAHYLQGDTRAALQHYQNALDREPCHWIAHRFYADVAYDPLMPDMAIEHAVDALACNPTYKPARHQVGYLVDQHGKHRFQGPINDSASRDAIRAVADPNEPDPVARMMNAARAAEGEGPLLVHLRKADTAGHLAGALHIQMLTKDMVPGLTKHRGTTAAYVLWVTGLPRPQR